MPALYQNSPLSFYPVDSAVAAGRTQRMVPSAGSSGQRTFQTYIPSVNVLVINGVWLHDLTELNPRHDLRGADPFQVFHIFTTSFSSPDGDQPYRQGDMFVPNGALVGLAANTQYPIRSIMPNYRHWELVIERKL